MPVKLYGRGFSRKNMGQLNPGRQIEPADRYDGSVLVRQRRKQKVILSLTSSGSAARDGAIVETFSAIAVAYIPVGT